MADQTTVITTSTTATASITAEKASNAGGARKVELTASSTHTISAQHTADEGGATSPLVSSTARVDITGAKQDGDLAAQEISESTTGPTSPGNGPSNADPPTKSLREKEVEFLKDKGVEKVADMATFGLYGAVTGIRDVARALHEDSEKDLAEDANRQASIHEKDGSTAREHHVNWRHKGYIAANAWTDGAVDIVEEVYERKKTAWKEQHEHSTQQTNFDDDKCKTPKSIDKQKAVVQMRTIDDDGPLGLLPESGC